MRDLESKLERLRRWHRQNVFNDGAGGDRHARALRRLGKTRTMADLLRRVRDEAAQRESDRLLRMWA